jgi:drug/metabolite transporter (DMT)-like permease
MVQIMNSTVVLSHLAMLGFSVFVGGSFVVSAILAEQISPDFLTLLRFALSAVLLISCLIYFKRKLEFLIRYWKSLSILGACYVFFFIFLFYSLRFTSPTSAAAIFTLLPFISLCLSAVFAKQFPAFRAFFILAVGASGALLVIMKGNFENLLALNFNFGDVLILLGTIFHSLYIVLLPRLKIKADALEITAGVTFYGAILLFFISFGNLNLEEVTSFSIKHWLSFFYLVVFASIGTFSLLAFASKNISSTNVSSYTYLIPVWAAIIETFVMMEKIPTYLWLGIIPILTCNILMLKLTDLKEKKILG